MQRVLKSLKHDTIYECVAEIRFAPANEFVADLLPGMLFSKQKHRFTRSALLPLGQMPKQMRSLDPNLKYQPTHVLEGNESKLMLGQHVAGLSFRRPYPGWDAVCAQASECFLQLLETDLVERVERVSLKYINVLTGGANEHDLSQLKLKFELDGFTLRGPGVSLIGEIELDGCTSIVNITSGATINLIGMNNQRTSVTGVLFAVDTIRNGPFDNFSMEVFDALKNLHSTEKQIFVSMLTEETLESLGPTWERIE